MRNGPVRKKSYAQERRVFDRLRSACSEGAKSEYETAVARLLNRYNTTVRENRFIVGGAVKFFTCSLLRSVGIDCSLLEEQSHPGDVLLPNNGKLLIKSTFTGGPADVRLMNKMGGGYQTWATATLFVISYVGLVYGSPDMVAKKHIQDVDDGTTLTKAGLQSLINMPNNLFEAEIAKKPPAKTTGFSEKASTAVARQILSEMPAKHLTCD